MEFLTFTCLTQFNLVIVTFYVKKLECLLHGFFPVHIDHEASRLSKCVNLIGIGDNSYEKINASVLSQHSSCSMFSAQRESSKHFSKTFFYKSSEVSNLDQPRLKSNTLIILKVGISPSKKKNCYIFFNESLNRRLKPIYFGHISIINDKIFAEYESTYFT